MRRWRGLLRRNPESRVLNFFATTALGLLAVSTLPGLLLAPEWLSLVDDTVLILAAAAAIRWYSWVWNRYRRSTTPLLFLLLGLATKLVAVGWPHSGAVARGIDLMCVTFLTGTAAVFMWHYWSSRPRP